MANNATLDISAITGTAASIRDVNFAGSGTGTINLGSKSLLVTHANGDFGTGTINGGAGANALHVTMDAAATGVSLAALAFTAWTDGADTIVITGNGLANTIFGSTRADSITPAAATTRSSAAAATTSSPAAPAMTGSTAAAAPMPRCFQARGPTISCGPSSQAVRPTRRCRRRPAPMGSTR